MSLTVGEAVGGLEEKAHDWLEQQGRHGHEAVCSLRQIPVITVALALNTTAGRVQFHGSIVYVMEKLPACRLPPGLQRSPGRTFFRSLHGEGS